MADASTVTTDQAKDDKPRGEARPAKPRDKEERRDEAPEDREGRSGEAEDKPKPKRSWRDTIRRHPWATAAVIIAVAAILLGVLLWWLHARHFENTDDAFIDARTVALGSEITGAITDVYVTDNQHVTAGQVLVSIDPRDYRAQLDQARAQVEQASAAIENYEAQMAAQQARITQAERQVSEAQAALKFSNEENSRYQDLFAKGAGTAQRAQQAASDQQQKQASLDAATAALDAAQKQVEVLRTQRDSAVAQRNGARAAQAAAQANLDRTTIVAPVAGRVTKLTAAKGAHATPGQALLMIVPDEVWVTANFKETQLTDMRVGQPVTISVDAYPGSDIPGHVDSIQAGSGTAFSLLPAENATGNYVKIVQRVPVKIVFDRDPGLLLGPGMSVVPSVRVR